jgi:hypothetical protein
MGNIKRFLMVYVTQCPFLNSWHVISTALCEHVILHGYTAITCLLRRGRNMICLNIYICLLFVGNPIGAFWMQPIGTVVLVGIWINVILQKCRVNWVKVKHHICGSTFFHTSSSGSLHVHPSHTIQISWFPPFTNGSLWTIPLLHIHVLTKAATKSKGLQGRHGSAFVRPWNQRCDATWSIEVRPVPNFVDPTVDIGGLWWFITQSMNLFCVQDMRPAPI